jgi:hypothetical protein
MVTASLVSKKNEWKIPPFFYAGSYMSNLYLSVSEPLSLGISCGICPSRQHIARKIKIPQTEMEIVREVEKDLSAFPKG